jgi:filamentous hemagglutinin family protein
MRGCSPSLEFCSNFRTALLGGVSALALLAYAPSGKARPLGFAATTAATTAAANAANVASQQAATIAQQSQQSLARAAAAIQAMRAAQTAARAAAQGGPIHLVGTRDVPDGLSTAGAGGLVPDSGLAAPGLANPIASWVGANTPTQTSTNGETIVTVRQTQAQALLYWQSFNIGRNTTLMFDQQGNQSWVALNRLTAGAVPSQILGQIKADGQVLLINPNGIIFGGTSQIDVHTLIASTLDLTPTFTANNYQLYLQNGLFATPLTVLGDPNARGSGAVFAASTSGAVTVEPGAMIDTSARLTPNGDGGFVALLGAGGVSNAGTIATQNGQIMLAAGNAIGLVEPASGAVGTQTAFQVIVQNGTTVSNAANALLSSNDGAVTLAGGVINQLGGIEATTSTTRTASILLNTALASGGGGNIVLGPDSVTTILPDESSTTLPTATANSTITTNNVTTPYFSTVLRPQITVQAGGSVDIQGHGAGLGGALIKAPSAALTVSAGGGVGTILLEPGSSIDLSGIAGVTLPMSINEVSILITQAEIADTPLAAALKGMTVTIDARLSGTRSDGLQWLGSPILDAAGYVGLIPETIDQLLTAGGSFTTSAQNFIQAAGASINVSGGYVQYSGGFINTTRLVGADGRIYDIGSAPYGIAYLGIAGRFTVDHAHWNNPQQGFNVTEIFTNPLIGGGHFEPGYIAGANAGSISVAAQVPILSTSDLAVDVVAGQRQRASGQMPVGASLSITLPTGGLNYRVQLEPQADTGSDPYGLVAGGFSFATASSWSPVLTNNVFPIFSDGLSQADFNSISIKGAHELNMTADAALVVRPGGSVTLDNVGTIDGVISAPAGKISLTGFTYDGRTQPEAPPTPAVVIGPDAVLDAHGLWVNDTGLSPGQMLGQAFINGGTISISTIEASNGPLSGPGVFTDVTQSIVLSPGSIIDVSGGGYVGPTRKLAMGSDGLPLGKGGSISLTPYVILPASPGEGGNAYNTTPSSGVFNLANVVLGGSIYAGGFDGGGTLTLQVPTILIDGAANQVTSYLSSAVAAADAKQSGEPLADTAISDAKAGQLVLPPSFFIGGFSEYDLTDVASGTTVTAGTQLMPRQTNDLIVNNITQIPTGALVRSFATTGFLPDGLRRPVSLSLTSNVANVLVDRGASIDVDPQATVRLNAGVLAVLHNITTPTATVLGSIIAPAGSIDAIGGTVVIGPSAMLDVNGTLLPNPRITTYSTGSVLDAGTITLSTATKAGGAVLVAPGAQFDLEGAAVSAASGLIELPAPGLLGTGSRFLGQTAWSNGGVLQLGGTVYFAGSVDAAGGAPEATGGTLSIGQFVASASPSLAALFLTETLPAPSTIVIEPAGLVGAHMPATAAAVLPGAFVGTDTLNNSGFDSVTLDTGGNTTAIVFNGSLTVTIPGALSMRANHLMLLPASDALLPAGASLGAAGFAYSPPSCGTSCIPGIGSPTVDVNAGYVWITGNTNTAISLGVPKLADSTLNISTQWIDLEGVLAIDDAANVDLTSSGAIRALPNNDGLITGGGSVPSVFGGGLAVPGNLTLRAAEIYPVSNTDFLLMSTGKLASASTILIEPNGTPVAPLSAGGELLLSAQTILQNGTLWAPLGQIIVGMQDGSGLPSVITSFAGNLPANVVPTETLILGAGSLTSVSAAGLVIPDGTTVDDLAWNIGSTVTVPPAKSISLFGANVTTNHGAVLDLSGGGDIYATEFVSGNGGTRNVLSSYQQNLAATAGTISTYADGRQVYALVPSYEAKVAAYDPIFAGSSYYSGPLLPNGNSNTGNQVPFANAIIPGQTVTIGAGSGIAAGTYVLLPGMYATLPGAYRVVQVASNANPSTSSSTGADGSQYVVGRFGNALTGARSSQSVLFQLQSQAVWSKYSRIDITSGTTFFNNLAVSENQAPPPLPIDGGVLVLGATNSLNLHSTNFFGPGSSPLAPGLVGAGGQVQISGTNILVLASDQAEPMADCKLGSAIGCTGTANYLVLDADQISGLGATTVLIGGTAKVASDGTEAITPVALNLEVKTDAARQLTGPELVLVTVAPTSTSPSVHGLTVDAGSVIGAVGSVPKGTDRDITIGADPVAQFNQGTLTGYTAGVTGDGSLLRVSNGDAVNVTRFFVPGLYASPQTSPAATPPVSKTALGQLTIQGAIINGGNALTLDSSGSGTLSSDTILKAANYDIAGSVINIGSGSSGVVLSQAVLANFADATSVTLRSATVINLVDGGPGGRLTIGDPNHPIGTLTFDSAGLFGQGGDTIINASNIDLANSRGATGTGNTGAGTLTLNASGTITEDVGSKSLASFGDIYLNAGQSIAVSGAGSLDAGPVAAATASLGVTQFAVSAGGSGYHNGDVVTVTGPGGTGFSGVAVVDSNGAISGVTITNAGTGFTGPVTAVSVASASGSGASLTAGLGVVGISLTQGGDGYGVATTVTISGGGGTDAAATAAVSAGAISGIAVGAGGSGYTSVPTIVFSGPNMHLNAPAIVVNSGAAQSLSAPGQVTLATTAGSTAPALAARNIGGALAVTGGSIDDTAIIQALSGNVSLTATNGRLALGAGATILAGGSEVTILDVIDDAPGGNVRLTSTTGDVAVGQGAVIDVSAAGLGYAGSLSIAAAGNTTLDGIMLGLAAFKDLGGNFSLLTNSFNGDVLRPIGFSGSFAVQLGQGSLPIDAGRILASGNVTLVANNGSVIVNGIIDASGPSGGTIALYGATGVSVGANAQLLARYAAPDPADPAYANGASTLVQTGGTITLGTSGTPATGANAINTTYGYENVTNSGAISVAAGAVLDVSGGPGGANINNAGGEIDLRAPLLSNNTVNIDFRGNVIGVADANGNAIGKGVVLSAYAVWSTTDPSTGALHFDSIIDPAGWFDDKGNPLPGTDQNGNALLAPTPQSPLATGQVFSVTTANPDHTGFYGNIDANGPLTGALPTFVTNFAVTPAGSGASFGGIANFHARPEIDLVNPNPQVNGGNVTVASNFNLGAGSISPTGQVTLAFRTKAGGEPGALALFARNNVQINATITDGFFTSYDPGGAVDAMTLYNSEKETSLYKTNYLGMFSDGAEDGVLQYDATAYSQLFGGSLSISTPSPGFFGLSQDDFNALKFTLQAPDNIRTKVSGPDALNIIDQYNQFYGEYVTMFRAYETELLAINKNGFNAAFYPGVPAVSGGIVMSYSDFVNASNTNGFLGVDPATIKIPSPVDTTGLYFNLQTRTGNISFDPNTGFASTTASDYVTQWTAYFYNVVNANLLNSTFSTLPSLVSNLTLARAAGADFANGALWAIAVTPPAPPPSYTVLLDTWVQSVNNPVHPADQIANNRAVYNVPGQTSVIVLNTTAAAQVMSAAVSGNGSFSYNFVAGAAFGPNNALSVNPNAVVPTSSLSASLTGNVTIDGHTSYVDPLVNNPNLFGPPLTVDIPTLVRTGTGSITMAAAGNVAFLDTTAPGAVYTAGVPIATPADFVAPSVPSHYTSTPNGLVSTPAWTAGGGAVTVSAGGSIIGIEMPVDADGSQTGFAGAPTGQMWSSWYYRSAQSNGSPTPFSNCCQTTAWVNFATFFQAFGALGGGNITLTAGADIKDIGASLPETLVVGGGTTLSDPPHISYYGGGNLRVTAGGSLLSSDFLVGRGTGQIEVAGSIVLDPSVKVLADVTNPQGNQVFLPLLLAVQDGFIAIAAKGSITVGGIYDPTAVLSNAETLTFPQALPNDNGSEFGSIFTSYGADSGVSALSLSGDVTALTVLTTRSLFLRRTDAESPSRAGLLLPATLELTALAGNIAVNTAPPSSQGDTTSLVPYPTQTGDDTSTLRLVAAGSIDLGNGLSMPDLSTSSSQFISNIDGTSRDNYISPLGVPLANLTVALHANDPTPVIIAAGKDILASGLNGFLSAPVSLVKPAEIEAGRNIEATGLKFTGENNNPTDITSIVAGNDLVGGAYSLYGPGIFLLQAGHNLGPFNGLAAGSASGIVTLGNGSALSSNGVRPYLPAQGAEVDVLFGIKPGIDYAGAIAAFGAPPSTPGGSLDLSAIGLELSAIIPQLEFEADLLIDRAAEAAGIPNPHAQVVLTPAEAFSLIALTSPQQLNLQLAKLAQQAQFNNLAFNVSRFDLDLVSAPKLAQSIKFEINTSFLNFLTQVGKDAKNPNSQFVGQYARAYQAISTLFPAGFGYTDNTAGAGGSNGAAATIKTGDLNIAASVLETQMGGDINILGPGGGIIVGHTSRDLLAPNQEGILTLGGGTIRAFTDGSILVNQSRIMTEQGGDLDLFTANGDISAGEGPKTYVSSPTVSEICDNTGFCHINPQGLVTGAGIAALVTLPGQDKSKSNANLFAPHGTIDAGSAGIRVAGNATFGALQILNAYNIQVQGTSIGLPTTSGPPVAALTTANNVAGSTIKVAAPAAADNSDHPSIIIVEILGYGGGEGSTPAEQPPADKNTKDKEKQSYNPNSALQYIGAGLPSEEQKERLIRDGRL